MLVADVDVRMSHSPMAYMYVKRSVPVRQAACILRRQKKINAVRDYENRTPGLCG
jgi:hypothetical protein